MLGSCAMRGDFILIQHALHDRLRKLVSNKFYFKFQNQIIIFKTDNILGIVERSWNQLLVRNLFKFLTLFCTWFWPRALEMYIGGINLTNLQYEFDNLSNKRKHGWDLFYWIQYLNQWNFLLFHFYWMYLLHGCNLARIKF